MLRIEQQHEEERERKLEELTQRGGPGGYGDILGSLPGLVLMRRQHWPDLAEQKGDTHIDLVMPRPRDPSPTPAPKTKGSPLLSSQIPPMAEAAGTRPPPTMMAEESTPGQLFAQAANLPAVSTQ